MEYNEEQSLKFLTDLFSQKCNIVAAGPLINTTCEPHILKFLETNLQEAIEKEVPITKDRSAYNYGVKIRKISVIKVCKEESDSICFEIRQNVSKFWLKGRSLPGSDSRLLFLGILASCGYAGHRLKRITTLPNTYLPVCIYKGQPKVWKIVKNTLYHALSCRIIPRELSDVNVKVIAGLHILQFLKSNPDKKNKIKCIVESEKDESSYGLEFRINLEKWAHLWNELKKDDTVSVSSASIDNVLMNWEKMTASLYADVPDKTLDEISKTRFEQIFMSDFYCNKSGQIKLKMMKKADVFAIINYLTCIFTGQDFEETKSAVSSKVPIKSSGKTKQAPVPVQPPKRRKTTKR